VSTLKQEILATVQLAHRFNSAFTPLQVWQLLMVKTEYDEVKKILKDLIETKILNEKKGKLYKSDFSEITEKKRYWSRALFLKNRIFLRLISKIPFIKYIGLTGANAFESCSESDDIDIFVVTASKRLWITYLIIVLFSKITGKRNTLCFNYLLDEDNLQVKEQNYFTAVQLMHMIPLFDCELNDKLVNRNNWVADFLPNANKNISTIPFYLIRKESRRNGRTASAKAKTKSFPDSLNKYIFRLYSKRLKRKYPAEFGKGIVLSEGSAKLNRYDYTDIYNKIYYQVKEAMAQ
jgi:hypothetical protein